MFKKCVFPVGAGLVVVALLLVPLMEIRAGEKKGEEKTGEKKGEPNKGDPIFSKTDELTANDEKDTHPAVANSPRKVYKVKLTEGKTYRIDLKSKDFDAVLRLEDAAGNELAFNDDAPGERTLDSRIIYKILKTGQYRLIATCLDTKPGRFTLTVVEEVTSKQDAKEAGVKEKTASKFGGKTIELKLKDGKVEYPTEFGENDLKFVVKAQKGEIYFHYKVFTVQLEKGKIYRIDHRGTGGDKAFDPFLFLEDANGVQLEQDDDSGGGLDARIVYKAPKTGIYRVVAATFVPKQTGKFTLEFGVPSKAEATMADLLYRVKDFAALAVPQRKALAAEVRKHVKGLNGDLTLTEFRLISQLSEEAEIEGAIDIARDILEDGVKEFSAAKNEQLSKLTDPLEAALKNLEKIGTKLEIAGMKTDGKEFDLAKLKGKVVLVDFWGTWCPPCVAEIPNIHEAYKKYHARGFEVIGVSSDKEDNVVVDFLKSRNLPWGCINVEDSAKLIKTYDINSYPSPMLVGTDGRIVSMRARGPVLDRLLERMLKEKK